MEKSSCLCGFSTDSADLFCRKCGKDCDPKWKSTPPYATVLTCDCCGDGADKGICRACGAYPTKMTKEEFQNYTSAVSKEYYEVGEKRRTLGQKKGALDRLKHNLFYPDGPECNCSAGIIRCHFHSSAYD